VVWGRKRSELDRAQFTHRAPLFQPTPISASQSRAIAVRAWPVLDCILSLFGIAVPLDFILVAPLAIYGCLISEIGVYWRERKPSIRATGWLFER
jgi:hypothetical protein